MVVSRQFNRVVMGKYMMQKCKVLTARDLSFTIFTFDIFNRQFSIKF